MRTLWERKLRMVWEIVKNDRRSFLVGTAHFFPHSFRKSLTSFIRDASAVLLEGPLDEGNMDAVRQYGYKGGEDSLLLKALNRNTLEAINRELGMSKGDMKESITSTIDFLRSTRQDLLAVKLEGLRPWMAFFNIWSQFLAARGWRHSVDLEALTVAKELGKKVVFLETIEEQLEALDGIPLERIVGYLNNFKSWGTFSRHHRRRYLKGSLDGLLSITNSFPTRCPSIIEQRDPVLYERMQHHIEAGSAAIFLGTTHIQGIMRLLGKDGYEVHQYLL